MSLARVGTRGTCVFVITYFAIVVIHLIIQCPSSRVPNMAKARFHKVVLLVLLSQKLSRDFIIGLR